MEQNTAFLQKILELFYLNGAKTTTMDDIAREFSMSKKTLYQQYENKEKLLDEVLNYELSLVMQELASIDSQDFCPIEKMICRDRKMKDMMENDNSLFVRQLRKYYYPLYEKQTKRIAKEVAQVLKANVEKGKELGLYRTDFHVEDYGKFLMLIMFSYNDSPIIDCEEVSRKEFAQSAILFYLNAITTEKGKEQLKKYI